MSYRVRIEASGHQFDCHPEETVLEAALRQGYALPYSCRSGACGSCKGQLRSGQVEYKEETQALSAAELASGMALLCRAHPKSDLEIVVREVGAARDIPVKIMPCRVQKKEQLAADVVRILLKLPKTERMQFLAGQYIDILLADGRRRSFSLANAPHADEFLELHIRFVAGGEFTQVVFDEMQEKALLRIEGPLGGFFLHDTSTRPIIFVAGGTGFAPVKSMLEHLFSLDTRRPLHFYWGARDLESLYMRKLPQKWAKQHQNFHFVPVLSEPKPEDKWRGRTGFVHHAVVADFKNLTDFDVYSCGPPAMVKAAYQELTTQGLPETQYFSDAFEFAKDKHKT
ncbi:MAG: CDP-6-deoxy-delta-3,4-glucoseen reductase [Pseudomonadota bacterium]